jgi:hypothetical protein
MLPMHALPASRTCFCILRSMCTVDPIKITLPSHPLRLASRRCLPILAPTCCYSACHLSPPHSEQLLMMMPPNTTIVVRPPPAMILIALVGSAFHFLPNPSQTPESLLLLLRSAPGRWRFRHSHRLQRNTSGHSPPSWRKNLPQINEEKRKHHKYYVTSWTWKH